MSSPLFGDDLQKLFPIIEPHSSDSGNCDNALELLYQSGRSLPEAMMMMIPEAWQEHHDMPAYKKSFYEFHSALQEPWDGPASISFSDGHYIGAVLDRNGLRPSRYYVTHDDRVIMASEVGVLEIDPQNVKLKGRLQPGKMFLVDFQQGRIIDDEELKKGICQSRPYGEWVAQQKLELSDLPAGPPVPHIRGEELLRKMQAFGYSTETMQFMLVPMLNSKKDPISSMGDDTALACLSDQPRLLYDYFKQLFAQVTNPAIDSIREEVIMSLECFIGPEANILDTTELHAHRLRVPHPILTDEETSAIKSLSGYRHWKSRTIDMTWARSDGPQGLRPAIERICREAEQAIADGYSLVVLSDRTACDSQVGIPALMACGAVHHHLVRKELRTRIGIVIETAEARDVHQFCLLAGYGADAINPYLAFEAIRDAKDHGGLTGTFDEQSIVKIYREAIKKGMLKVMGKIGDQHPRQLQGRADLRSRRHLRRSGRPLLPRHGQPHQGDRLRHHRRRDDPPSRSRLPQPHRAGTPARAAQLRKRPLAIRRRTPSLESLHHRRAAERCTDGRQDGLPPALRSW